MNWHYHEPALTELMSDPIVRSLMKADRVDPSELEATLTHMAAQIAEREGRHECSRLVPRDQPEDFVSRLSTR